MRVQGFRPWIDAGAYDVMMPDVKYAGGPDEMLRIANAMAGKGIMFSPHNPSGPISHMHSAHICAVCPCADLLEHQFDETPLFQHLLTPKLPSHTDGAITLPDSAGLGVALDESSHPFDVLVSVGGLQT